MAEPISIQQLKDASLDVKSLEEVVNGDENVVVTTRLGETYPSVKGSIKQVFEIGGLPATPFATKALMTASALVDGDYAYVTDDTENNGLYVKTSGTWVKSDYDPLAQAKTYADAKTNVVKEYIDSKELNVVDNISNNDFKNNDLSGWVSLRDSAVANNESMVVTHTNTVKLATVAGYKVDITKNHTYLVRARMKTNASNCKRLLVGSDLPIFGGYIEHLNPTANEWVELSQVVTLKDREDTTLSLIVAQEFDSIDAAQNTQMSVDYASMIDLTTTFPNQDFSSEAFEKLIGSPNSPNTISLKNITDYILHNKLIATETPTPPVNLDKVIELTQEDKQPAGEVELFKGQYIRGMVVSDGTISAEFTYVRWTGYIDVSDYISIKLSGFVMDDCNYAFYDADYGVLLVGNAKSGVLNGTLEVPDNAKYFARTLRRGGPETIDALSIKGVYARDRFNVFAVKHDFVPYASADKHLEVKDVLWDAGAKLVGNFTATGVDTSTAGFKHLLIDVADYNTVELTRFTSELLSRHWLDADKQVIASIDAQTEPSSWNRIGSFTKPKNAHYFVANVVTPTVTDDQGLIYGKRGVNTSDFQRKGVTGDAAAGWETAPDLLSTSNVIEIFNPHYPEIMPLKIMNNGIMDNYNYGNRLGMETAITREAWGMQMWMNWTKARHPLVQRGVKNIKSENSLLQEWGLEGLQWHVVPPNVDIASMKTTQAIKFGGHSPRTDTNYSFAKASIGQILTPVWSERSDGQAFGWIKNSTNPVNDDAIPTRVMLRESVHFKSPEYYRMGYGNTQNATWDRHVRARGTFKVPTATADGDSIHKQLYSVVTGKDAQNNPILKDVAQIEIVYDESGGADGDNAASIIFRTWNNATESWDEKLKL